MVAGLAVFAVSAVASASASAQPHWWLCKKVTSGKFLNAHCTESGAGTWEWEALPAETSVKVKSKGGKSVLESPGKIIECKKVEDTGSIENPTGGGAGIGKLTEAKFSECTVTKPAKCTVTEPIVVKNAKTALSEPEAGVFHETFTPEEEEGKLFTEIKLGGSECAGKGKFKVRGKATATVNGANAELTFTGALSELTLGEEVATFESKETQETEAGEGIDVRNP
ncbi:MAG: hypothetical protein ACRET5_08950 [Steroidobacteraceae bacterium]